MQEEGDRILSIVINANWLYTEEDAEFGPLWHAVTKILLEAFAEHHSHWLQLTLYAMGDGVLSNFENIREIHLSLPSKHYHLADLAPLGMDNPGTVFLPADEPHAIIEATLRKS